MASDAALWEPSAECARETRLASFMRLHAPGSIARGLDYDRLWDWSVTDTDAFWRAVWEFCGVVGTPGEVAFVPAEHPIDARFFPTAQLNFAENLLAGNAGWISFHGEDGSSRRLTGPEFRELVRRIQSAMRAAGLRAGDHVGAIVPNTPETLAAMAATAGLGAVWSSCSPDFGIRAVIDRFRQIKPRLLFATNGYFYGGRWHATLDRAGSVVEMLTETPDLVILPYHGLDSDHVEDGPGRSLSAFLDDGAGPVALERYPFRHPLFVMFSSGTTGLPKCIHHSAGGTLLKHVAEHQLQCDLRHGDRMMFFSTCGWMMWNWLASALASGVSVVLYDGSPFHPSARRLIDIAQREQLTHFGASAKYFDACAKAGLQPARSHDLRKLRVILSTGSPLPPASFDYIYSSWKRDVCVSSIAGGTDIIGCFVGGSPISPVYRGQCQKRMLGMNVEVYDSRGDAVIGEPGELVCATPHPSMPIGFGHDADGSKYRDAYFSTYDGVWRHGDWVVLTPEGGMEFRGRSDATLNPGGVRIGTAEIYRPVEEIDDVLEALAVARTIDSDTEILLFVRLREGVTMSHQLDGEIRQAIRTGASPRHVPAQIIAAPDLPRTKSGKISEIAVRNLVNGGIVVNDEALENPQSLAFFEAFSVDGG